LGALRAQYLDFLTHTVYSTVLRHNFMTGLWLMASNYPTVYTNGCAYACCVCRRLHCLYVRNVLWLNGESYSKSYYWQPI